MFFDRLRGALPAIGLALVVVVVTVAFFVGRTTAPGKAAAGPTPTAPVGGSGPVVPVSGGGIPGAPTRLNSLGIPVGYPHTQAGAISACANYVSAYESRNNRGSARIHQVFAAIAAPSASARLAKRVSDSNAAIAKNFGVSSVESPRLSFDIRPAGYQVRSTKKDRVVVSVWSTAGVGQYDGADTTAAQQSWGTDVCTVAWQSDDWKLVDANDGPAGPAITERSAGSFTRFSYIGGAT